MISLLLTRWRIGLGIAGALAFMGLAGGFAWAWEGWSAEKALRAADKASYYRAQAEAELIARRALDAVEARYRSKANEADRMYQARLDGARSSTDAYLARMRVKAASCPASAAVASAEDHAPGVPANVPSLALMDEADVRAAAEWQAYGSQCRDWALTLVK